MSSGPPIKRLKQALLKFDTTKTVSKTTAEDKPTPNCYLGRYAVELHFFSESEYGLNCCIGDSRTFSQDKSCSGSGEQYVS